MSQYLFFYTEQFLDILSVISIELYEEFLMSSLVTLLANIVAPLQRQFINFIRIAICVVMV